MLIAKQIFFWELHGSLLIKRSGKLVFGYPDVYFKMLIYLRVHGSTYVRFAVKMWYSMFMHAAHVLLISARFE